MSWKYKIGTNNEVTVFLEGSEGGIVQPNYPDGTPWGSKAAAEAWAKAKVAELTDPTAPAAGNSPDQPVIERGEYVEPELPQFPEAPEFEEAIAAEEPAPAPAE
jgi:hypothetical protein